MKSSIHIYMKIDCKPIFKCTDPARILDPGSYQILEICIPYICVLRNLRGWGFENSNFDKEFVCLWRILDPAPWNVEGKGSTNNTYILYICIHMKSINPIKSYMQPWPFVVFPSTGNDPLERLAIDQTYDKKEDKGIAHNATTIPSSILY